MRECCSSYTTALIIEDEKAETLRLAIIQFCIELRPRDGPFAVVRTDPSPGFQALANDLILKFHRISIELGRLKNGKKPCHRTCSPRRREHIPRIDPIARAVFSLLLSLDVATVTVRFNKGVCLQGRCLLKGTSLQIDNCLYQTGSSYYRHTRLAKPITPAVRI